MNPDPNSFDLWIDPTALTIIGCVFVVVAGLVAMVAIVSWQNVKIAQATGQNPRAAAKDGLDLRDDPRGGRGPR